MEYAAILLVENYDHDFVLGFDGEKIREGSSVVAFGDTPALALESLRSRITYYGSFFSDYYEADRTKPTDGWGKAWYEDLIELQTYIATGDHDIVRGIITSDDDGWYRLSWSGNRELTVTVEPHRADVEPIALPKAPSLREVYELACNRRLTYADFIKHLGDLGLNEK